MRYFPIFLDLNQKPVLVVGGGEVACRKVESLLRAGALVTLIAPQIHPQLKQAVDKGELIWLQDFYHAGMLDNFIQVWATTDNPSLNHQVYQDAHAANILVNVVDDPKHCDFITPSILNRGRIQIAISSGGSSPVLIRKLRERLESQLAQNLALLADFAASKRQDIQQKLPSVDDRRKFWEVFFEAPSLENIQTRHELEDLYQGLLQQAPEQQGRVHWIEFGDDAEMLSLKALRLMQQAEFVFYPADCPFEFIDLVRRDAERTIYHEVSELDFALSQMLDKRICIFIDKHNREPKLELMIAQKDLIPIVI